MSEIRKAWINIIFDDGGYLSRKHELFVLNVDLCVCFRPNIAHRYTYLFGLHFLLLCIYCNVLLPKMSLGEFLQHLLILNVQVVPLLVNLSAVRLAMLYAFIVSSPSSLSSVLPTYSPQFLSSFSDVLCLPFLVHSPSLSRRCPLFSTSGFLNSLFPTLYVHLCQFFYLSFHFSGPISNLG